MRGQDHHTTISAGLIRANGRAAAFGGLTGFQRHHIGSGGLNRQRRDDAGQHIGAVQVAVQHQHLHERPRTRGVPVGWLSARGCPKRVMLGGEHLGRAGLRQSGRVGQRAGRAVQDLQM